MDLEATPTGNVRYTVNYRIRDSMSNKVITADSFSGESTESDVDGVIQQRAIKIVHSRIFIEIKSIFIEAEEKIVGTEEICYRVMRNQTFNVLNAPTFFDHMK